MPAGRPRVRPYNSPMLFDAVAVVGVGLIGGSVGLAAKARAATRRVIGIGRHPDSLAQAQELGAVDEFTTDLAQGVRSADVVVFCSPVDRIARQVREAAQYAMPGALFTDAGSTKGNIVRDLDGKLPDHVKFVGAHPLAGSEKQGVVNATADLFDGRVCVITPTANSTPWAVERATLFWQALGSEVKTLTPEEHDLALATTSHVPHMVAAVLAAQLPKKWQAFAASGFKDTTRIAAGDPALWMAIARENAAALSLALERFDEDLQKLRRAVLNQNEDALTDILTAGKKVRDALGS
jgi:cyclohexadieny/prephenate dehydrogenase